MHSLDRELWGVLIGWSEKEVGVRREKERRSGEGSEGVFLKGCIFSFFLSLPPIISVLPPTFALAAPL